MKSLLLDKISEARCSAGTYSREVRVRKCTLRLSPFRPNRKGRHQLKNRYKILEKRTQVQSGIVKKLEKEGEKLLVERKAKFNEYKSMYDIEVANLMEQYKVAVEEARMQLSPEAQENDLGRERDTLRRENEGLVGLFSRWHFSLC